MQLQQSNRAYIRMQLQQSNRACMQPQQNDSMHVTVYTCALLSIVHDPSQPQHSPNCNDFGWPGAPPAVAS